MMLVTRQEAKHHCYVTHDSDDTLIDAQIKAASGIVLNYLKTKRGLYESEYDENGDLVYDSNDNPVPVVDSSGQKLIREEVKAAVLIMVGILYRDRDGSEMQKWDTGYLPAPVTALLYPLRDPALR